MYWGKVSSTPGSSWMSKKSSDDESITGLARTTRESPPRAAFGVFGQRKPIATSAVGSTVRIAERTRPAHHDRFSSIISCFWPATAMSYVEPLPVVTRPAPTLSGAALSR